MISIFNGQMRRFGGASQREIYARVDVEMRDYLHHFKGPKLAVFLAIALHADENGQSNPSVKKLEMETGYDRETIFKALSDLCGTTINGQRLLAREQTIVQAGRFGANLYTVFPVPDSPTESVLPNTVAPNTVAPNTVGADTKYNQSEEEPVKEKPTVNLFANLAIDRKAQAAARLMTEKPEPTLDEKIARIRDAADHNPSGNTAAWFEQQYVRALGNLPDIKSYAAANKALKPLVQRFGAVEVAARLARFFADANRARYGYEYPEFVQHFGRYAFVPLSGNNGNGYTNGGRRDPGDMAKSTMEFVRTHFPDMPDNKRGA